MRLFIDHIKESIDYTLSDKTGIIIVSSLVSIACFINKNSLSDPILKVINVFLLIVVGYGSYVSWYALKGRDEHPRFKNNMKRLVWEGFKKSVIVFIYSGFLYVLIRLAKLSYADGNLIFTVCSVILFILLYLCLIAGLLNRYLHNGKIATFFLAPFLYISSRVTPFKSISMRGISLFTVRVGFCGTLICANITPIKITNTAAKNSVAKTTLCPRFLIAIFYHIPYTAFAKTTKRCEASPLP